MAKRSNTNKVTKKSIGKTTKAKTKPIKLANLKRQTKGKGQKGSSKGGELPNPFLGEFQKLPTIDEKLRAYTDIRKRVNQQLAKKRKEGVSQYIPIYRQLESEGVVTSKGNVGFSSKFNKRMLTRKNNPMSIGEFNKGLIEEYKRLYEISKNKSLYTSKKFYKPREQLSKELAKKGIDEEELKKTPEGQKKLRSYWDLRDAIEKAGLADETVFNLTSDEVQDIAIQFHAKYYDKNLDYDKIAKTIRVDFDAVLLDNQGSKKTKDEIMYNHYYGHEFGISLLDEFMNELAKKLAKKSYGQKPVMPIFSGGMGDFAKQFRR